MMIAIDPLQRRAGEIYEADRGEEANDDLQRVYSGLMTAEGFEEKWGD